MKRLWIILAWVLICLSSLCLPVNAFGREGTFGLYPAEYNETLSPGQTGLFELFIYNNTDHTLEFFITIMGCGIDRNGVRYYPDLKEAGEYSAVKWLKLTGMDTDSSLVISADQRRGLLVEVHVPEGTKPGEYYAVVFVEPKEFNVIEQGSLRFQTKTRIGALVKILVPGPISTFEMRSTVSEIRIDMPDNELSDLFRNILEKFDEEMKISDDIVSELTQLLQQFGARFSYEDYKLLPAEQQEEYFAWVRRFVEQMWMEQSTVKVVATFSTVSRKMLFVKGQVSIYQDIVGENGKRQRILRDRFTLTPAGSTVKGEEKVMPGGIRDFFGAIERPLPVGEYTAEVRFEYRGEGDEYARLALGQATFSIPQELVIRQKDMLLLVVTPDLLEYEMVPGEYHVKAVTVENLDTVEPLRIQLGTDVDWIEISSTSFLLQPGRKQSFRIAVKIPRDAEVVDRTGRIYISTDHGKVVYVDVKVRDKRNVN
jgi:hypothetical protein